jgi:hypothetical protein
MYREAVASQMIENQVAVIKSRMQSWVIQLLGQWIVGSQSDKVKKWRREV